MVCLAPRAPGDSVRPRRLAGASVRPLTFTVRRPGCHMKRWLAVGAAAIGAFAIGLAAGIILSSKASQHLREECLALFSDKSLEAFTLMDFLASGNPDRAYDVLESDATSCLLSKGPDLKPCTTRLKLFYEHHPDRQVSLEQRHADVARALGYANAR